MKKYTTKPIDFTGCHPVIAEHLKQGEAIECMVWDYDDLRCGSRRFVYQYMGGEKYPYVTNGGTHWMYAEPIPIKVKIKRIMPPERAIQVLIAEGFAFTSTGYLSGPGMTILTPQMYALMGEDLDGKAGEFAWPDSIIEEVEDDDK